MVFGLIWEAIARGGLVNRKFFPPVSEVLRELSVQLGNRDFWTATGQTMTAWLIGLAIAVIGGAILGFLIGLSPFLMSFTRSTIEFLRPIPSVAYIPLVVILFGAQLTSSLALVVYACLWPVLIQVLYGVADVDSVATNTARTFGLGALARLRYVTWPTALPYLITGIRLAATIALVVAVTAELVIGVPGLGRSIAFAQGGGAAAVTFALAIVIGFIGLIINLGMRFIERRALAWHTSIRMEIAA